ncbi:MAG: SMP-30/gluconolactonase/LRE family protein [Prosthecobacter sp.]
MLFKSPPLLALGLVLASCSSMRSPIVPGAKPKDHGAIGATEGPAWKDGSLYFTDGKHINRMGPDGKTTIFRHNASNGLAFDKEGRLIACESGLRRVTRTEKDGSITVMADRFGKMRFNSPNDLCMDSWGSIYFTDPRYGSRKGMEIKPNGPNPFPVHMRSEGRVGTVLESVDHVLGNEMIEGVYRIDAPGKMSKVLTGGSGFLGLQRPNGILISPDDRYLYIADNNNNTHGGSRKLLRYTLNKDGEVDEGSRKVIFDWKNGRGPDGMKMDGAGRIYVAAGVNKANEFETTEFKAGCYILSPSGRLLDFIPTAPDEACNCAFGGADGKTLFITSGGHLWSVPLR